MLQNANKSQQMNVKKFQQLKFVLISSYFFYIWQYDSVMLIFWTLLESVCIFGRIFAVQVIHLLRHCTCTSQPLSYGISADLRFITCLLSIQVGQLCSEIESKARNQMTLDLTAFL